MVQEHNKSSFEHCKNGYILGPKRLIAIFSSDDPILLDQFQITIPYSLEPEVFVFFILFSSLCFLSLSFSFGFIIISNALSDSARIRRTLG